MSVVTSKVRLYDLAKEAPVAEGVEPVKPQVTRVIRKLAPAVRAPEPEVVPLAEDQSTQPELPIRRSLKLMSVATSKVRLYDLAKELKIDTKRLIEEVRREGVDVTVPSHSVSKELAEKIRGKYFPKDSTVARRAIRIVKKAAKPIEELPPPEPPRSNTAQESHSDAGNEDLLPLSLDAADDVLDKVRKLVPDYAGVILTGPPGTSKTWYARQIAAALTDRDRMRVRFVQFHPSYQYEDFVEGYVPRKNGKGFDLRNKHLLEMCRVAREFDDKTCVLVIDELSRSDPGRVFGEALTYIEPTQRDVEFCLASGKRVKIPRNLFFIATMNPLDRGVDEVDAALDRRFAKIAMDPSPERLTALLNDNGVSENLRNLVVKFFQFLLNNRNERCRVGHAYFRAIRTEQDLGRLWDHQLRFHMEKAFQVDRESFRHVEDEWNRTFPSLRASRG